jgi:GAF domain-containing protein
VAAQSAGGFDLMHLDNLDRILDEERKLLHADSCTFYVRDPYWPDRFRLVSMPGVRLREPMHGFIFTEGGRRVISEGEKEVFCTEPEQFLPPEEEPPTVPLTIRRDLAFLFRDFAGREGVKSFARLFHIGSGDVVDAILFVNFSEKKEFDPGFRTAIHAVLSKIVGILPDVADELRGLDAEHLAESVKILHPAQALAKTFQGAASEGSELREPFENILRLSLGALGVSEAEGIGTIHLYTPEKGTLQLAAFCGSAPKIEDAKTQIASAGVGVVSWVALTQKALLIGNIATSEFGKIKVVINDDVKSELAVPMVADGQLVGVLNLESTKENAFQPASVRSIWYAAYSAAVAVQLARRAYATRRLLSICETAANDKGGVLQAVSDIANVLSDTLSADSCDLWHYNLFLDCFDVSGSTFAPFQPALRAGGWSNYIRKNRQPVWLGNIASKEDFLPKFWNQDHWEDSASAGVPSDLNLRVVERDVKAELGMPITVSNDCVGIAWIKYLRHREPPSRRRMDEARLVGRQAGLVLEAVQRHVEGPYKKQLEMIGEKLKPFSASCELDFRPLPLEGFVKNRSYHAHVCGDFHALTKVDNSVVGLLIGDGEGKAVSGLLNALPLITGFEVFGRGSGSTRHVMDKLRAISRKLGLAGTALYWTFTAFGDDVWLAMTCAGHELPILLRQTEEGVTAKVFPSIGSHARGIPLGYDIDSPQGEHYEKILPGDILIAFTDGVSDGLANSTSELAETPAMKMMNVAWDVRYLPCQKIAEAIIAAAEKESPLTDDATVCVVRRKPMRLSTPI